MRPCIVVRLDAASQLQIPTLPMFGHSTSRKFLQENPSHEKQKHVFSTLFLSPKISSSNVNKYRSYCMEAPYQLPLVILLLSEPEGFQFKA